MWCVTGHQIKDVQDALQVPARSRAAARTPARLRTSSTSMCLLMATSILCLAKTLAMANVPVVSMLAAMMGIPVHVLPLPAHPVSPAHIHVDKFVADAHLFLKVKVRSSETSERDLSVERFGRMRTSCRGRRRRQHGVPRTAAAHSLRALFRDVDPGAPWVRARRASRRAAWRLARRAPARLRARPGAHLEVQLHFVLDVHVDPLTRAATSSSRCSSASYKQGWSDNGDSNPRPRIIDVF